jgi:hypothetical protein
MPLSTAACIQFTMDCLNPEMWGHNTTPEMRDAARRALGMPASECPQPSVTKPETYRHEGIGTSYDQTERTELERNDK